MNTNTVQFYRVLRTTPERLYRAFMQAEAWAKWLPPHGFVATVHLQEARVGGRYKMSFTNLTTGHSHAFGGEYLELIPHRKIRYTAVFDDPHLTGTMQTTASMTPGPFGVALHIVQEGIPEVIPLDACNLGWQESLQLLTLLVEPEIHQ